MTKKLLLPLAVAAIAMFGFGSTAQASSDATISASCSSKGKFPPASYVTSIAAKGVSCGKARKVVKAYHACRRTPKGKCGRKVLGFKCREGRRQTVPGVQFSVGVSCTKGSAKVNSSYTQNI
jgi:hypothetical protein